MKRTLALVLTLILAAGCIAWAEGELPAPLECGHTEYTETENAALAEDVSGTQILRVCADCGWVTAETVDEPSWAQGRQPYFGLDCGHDAEYETTTQFAPPDPLLPAGRAGCPGMPGVRLGHAQALHQAGPHPCGPRRRERGPGQPDLHQPLLRPLRRRSGGSDL